MLNILYVILCGIALPVGGVQMQYLWRNQLGDIYSLGLGSAACLGAAAATMSGWCSLTMGAFICQAICAVIVSLVALRLNTSRLITFGILFMVSVLVTSVVSICGTIGFVSLGIPNLARIIIKPGDIRKQYALSAGMGTALLMVTYIVVEYCNFGIYLPVSATMAIIAMPLMLIIFRNSSSS